MGNAGASSTMGDAGASSTTEEDWVCIRNLTNKQNLNFLKSSYYRKVFYSRTKIMEMLLTWENLRTFSGFWFKIVYLLFLCTSWRLFFNAHYFQWSSAASTHMTNIDAVLAVQIHLARHCRAVNRLMPNDPTIPQLCSDLMLYMAHNSTGYAPYPLYEL